MDNKNQILKIIKLCYLIILPIFYEVLVIILLKILGINYANMSGFNKIIINSCADILFMTSLLIFFRKDLIRNIRDFKKNPSLGLAIKYWLIGFGIMIFSNRIITLINGGSISGNEEAVRELLFKYPFYMLFQVSIYAPFTEEIIYRKAIGDLINNKYIYVLISGLAFGGMHIVGSYRSVLDLLFIIPYASLGCCFALLYRKTNNIFSTIFIHSLHNTLTFILLIFLEVIRWKKYYTLYLLC